MSRVAYESISSEWLRREPLDREPLWSLVHEHLLIRGRIASSCDLALVELRGKITAESASALSQALDELVGRGATSVHIDLSAVVSVDGCGVRTLARTASALEARSGRLRVRNARGTIERLFFRTGLGRLMIASAGTSAAAELSAWVRKRRV